MRGDALWEMFEAEGSFFPETLKNILSLCKKDSLFALVKFTTEDKKKIEKLMRETFPELLKDEEKKKYYDIFATKPEKFVILEEAELDEMVLMAKRIAKANQLTLGAIDKSTDRGRINSGSSSKPSTGNSNASTSSSNASTSKTTATEEDMNKEIINQKGKAETLINDYIEKYLPEIIADKENAVPVVVEVSRDGFESFVGMAHCPLKTCTKVTKVSKIGSRWNPGNFYSHVKTHTAAHKQDIQSKKRKKTPLIKNFLITENAENSDSADDPGETETINLDGNESDPTGKQHF